jgi:hypothetical protein
LRATVSTGVAAVCAFCKKAGKIRNTVGTFRIEVSESCITVCAFRTTVCAACIEVREFRIEAYAAHIKVRKLRIKVSAAHIKVREFRIKANAARIEVYVAPTSVCKVLKPCREVPRKRPINPADAGGAARPGVNGPVWVRSLRLMIATPAPIVIPLLPSLLCALCVLCVELPYAASDSKRYTYASSSAMAW